MKRLAVIVLFTIAVTIGCVTPMPNHPGKVCVQITPHADNDPDQIIFQHMFDKYTNLYYEPTVYHYGIWYGDHGEGTPKVRLGFANAEDDSIWNDRRCL